MIGSAFFFFFPGWKDPRINERTVEGPLYVDSQQGWDAMFHVHACDKGEHGCLSPTIYVHLMRPPRMQAWQRAKETLIPPPSLSPSCNWNTSVLFSKRVETRAAKGRSFLLRFQKIISKCGSWLVWVWCNFPTQQGLIAVSMVTLMVHF